jgi:hypothetical protein
LDIAVLNNSGAAILMGQVVYQTGFVQPQQVPSIGLASAVATSTATVLGLVVASIPDGTIGQVRISGDFAPIDTSLFLPYGKVYLSDTPGEISPFAGTIEVVLGQVKVASLTGCIRVVCPIASGCALPSSGGGTKGDQGETGIQGIQGETGIGSGGGGGGVTGLQGATGIGAGSGTGAANTLNMNVLGNLSFAGSLPAVNLGPELTGGPTTYIDFRGRRAVPGTAGTTSIQLELNGTPVGGAVLSWLSSDPAFTLKSAVIALAVVAGDRLSFRLVSREAGSPRDIYTEVNA